VTPTPPTAAEVQAFVVANLAGALAEHGIDPAAVGEDFDLLTSGVIDSFGILELIADVNERFGIEIDFEELDPEGLTIVGQFSAYVARMAAPAAA
jgi:acyl carrier protein